MLQRLLDRLVALRKRAGLSAKELSVKLDRGEDYMYRVENGRFFPPVKDLETIMTNCNSSLEELFYEEFDSYRLDKEIIKNLRKMDTKGKEAFLTLLVMRYHQSQGGERKMDGASGEIIYLKESN